MIVKGLVHPVLGLDWGVSGTWANFSEKNEIVGQTPTRFFTEHTAHNDKKCGNRVLEVNEINSFRFKDFKNSAIRFEEVEVLDCVRGLSTHPPIESNRGPAGGPYLLLSINCKDFQRVFIRLYIKVLRIIMFLFFEQKGVRGKQKCIQN